MLLLLMTLLTGVLYPLVVTAIGQALFPSRVNGSIMERNGKAVGSRLIGQAFASPGYFWSRPSATTPFPYNASSSMGSNYGPLNPAFLKSVKDRVDLLHAADPENSQPVPVDLVTASASGLDPHISIAAAMYQVHRVSRARNLPEAKVRALVNQYTDPRDLALLGEPGVNVVRLNLALDESSRENR
jgi:K+-transporting ATPase ATPase C chain